MRTTVVEMAKKKKPDPDRHRPRFTIRLPEAYRTAVRALSKANRRTITEEVMIALDERLEREGHERPVTD
jgi:hypothetical protein